MTQRTAYRDASPWTARGADARSWIDQAVALVVVGLLLWVMGAVAGVIVYPLGVIPVWWLGRRDGPTHAAIGGVLYGLLAVAFARQSGLPGLVGLPDAALWGGWALLLASGLAIGRGADVERRLRHEVEARARAEGRLVAHDAWLGQVLENVPAVLWVTDADLRVVAADGLGFTENDVDPTQFVGHRVDEVVPLDLLVAHRAVMAGQRPEAVELTMAGRTFEIQMVALTREGVPDGVIGVGLDVTERVRTADSLASNLRRERELSEELRHVDEVKNAFLQAVSHELRTPLTALSGFAATLKRSSERLSQPQREMVLERIHHNAEKLTRLLTDLLDVDRLSRGIIDPVRTHVDVASLVLGVLDETDLGSRPLYTAIESTRAYIDASKVERIVENLLHNAARHTPPSTALTVRVRPDGGIVTIAVEQVGVAVADELKQRIFAPFAQGPSARESATPGTGIGLSLVQRFAELHGGRAWVKDGPAGGAIFGVDLPDGLDVPDGVELSNDRRAATDGPPENDADAQVPLRR